VSLVARDPRVLWRRSADRVVLLAPEAADPMVLDGVGAVVWELLGEPASADELIDLLAEHFERDDREVTQALEPFLAELSATGALTDVS
jgi:hypothetical protein